MMKIDVHKSERSVELILKRISIRDALIFYKKIAAFRQIGTKLVGPCPIHNGVNPEEFQADVSTNLWICNGKCNRNGNVINLIKNKENMSYNEAISYINQIWIFS